MKETVLIENLDNDRVCIYSNDLGIVLEVCTKRIALKRYNIIGEIYGGETKYFNSEEEEIETYSELLDPDVEED